MYTKDDSEDRMLLRQYIHNSITLSCLTGLAAGLLLITMVDLNSTMNAGSRLMLGAFPLIPFSTASAIKGDLVGLITLPL
jgi:hypothetical protein